MRNTSFAVFLFVLTLSTTQLVAQANLLNARVPQEVGKLNDQQIAANDEDPLPMVLLMTATSCGPKPFGNVSI